VFTTKVDSDDCGLMTVSEMGVMPEIAKAVEEMEWR